MVGRELVIVIASFAALGATKKLKPDTDEGGLVRPGSGSEPAVKLSDGRAEQHRKRVKAVRDTANALFRLCKEEEDPLERQGADRDSALTSDADTKKKLKSAGLPDEKIDLGKLRAECPKICARAVSNPDPKPIDFCMLTDPALAGAAIIADWKSVEVIESWVSNELSASLKSLSFSSASTNLPDKLSELERKSPVLALSRATAEWKSELHGATEAPAIVDLISGVNLSQWVTQALQALAKVVADRAEREALGWILDKLSNDLCATGATAATKVPEWVRAELAAHWLPSLCTVARKDRLAGYGAGAALLETLRSAIVSDIAHLPAMLGGLVLGQIFWTEANLERSDEQSLQDRTDLFICGLSGDKPPALVSRCDALQAVRTDAEGAIASIARGDSAVAVLHDFAESFDGRNRTRDADTDPYRLHAPGLEVIACAVSIPRVFEIYQSEISVHSGDVEQTEVGVLAAVAFVPACWTLLGKGYRAASCVLPNPGEGCTDQIRAIDRDAKSGPLESLSTLLRLGGPISTEIHGLASRATAVYSAYERLAAILSAPAEDASKLVPSVSPPKLPQVTDPSGASAARESIVAYVGTILDTARKLEVGRRMEAVLALADATLGFARSAATTIGEIEDRPGLCFLRGADKSCVAKRKLKSQNKDEDTRVLFDRASRGLTAMASGTRTLRAVASEDWGGVVTSVLSGSEPLLKDACTKAPDCARVVSQVGKYSGMLVAIAGAKNADDMAQAIDQAATPIGGWRKKANKGATTLSITGHPGLLLTGAEFRHGKYGDADEKGVPHYQPPTLALPIGLELAFGEDCWISPTAFYVPVIDPAAFLQYDPGTARLPGPRPITALSPGLGIRFGVRGTPFGIMPLFTYRPKLRTIDPTVSGPGADAFQFSLAATVDVTLWELYQGGDE